LEPGHPSYIEMLRNSPAVDLSGLPENLTSKAGFEGPEEKYSIAWRREERPGGGRRKGRSVGLAQQKKKKTTRGCCERGASGANEPWPADTSRSAQKKLNRTTSLCRDPSSPRKVFAKTCRFPGKRRRSLRARQPQRPIDRRRTVEGSFQDRLERRGFEESEGSFQQGASSSLTPRGDPRKRGGFGPRTREAACRSRGKNQSPKAAAIHQGGGNRWQACKQQRAGRERRL